MCSYVAQYPVFTIDQNPLHLTPGQTCSIEHHRDFSETKHPVTLPLLRRHAHPPLSIARYLLILLSELEQCGVNELDNVRYRATRFEPGFSFCQESEVLATEPLRHCASTSPVVLLTDPSPVTILLQVTGSPQLTDNSHTRGDSTLTAIVNHPLSNQR